MCIEIARWAPILILQIANPRKLSTTICSSCWYANDPKVPPKVDASSQRPQYFVLTQAIIRGINIIIVYFESESYITTHISSHLIHTGQNRVEWDYLDASSVDMKTEKSRVIAREVRKNV